MKVFLMRLSAGWQAFRKYPGIPGLKVAYHENAVLAAIITELNERVRRLQAENVALAQRFKDH